MAEYVLQDKDKAAFINKLNKVLSQLNPGLGVDNTSFVDVPEEKDEDKCIFVTGDPVEEKVLDQLIDRKAFNFRVKKISLKEILREIRNLSKGKTYKVSYFYKFTRSGELEKDNDEFDIQATSEEDAIKKGKEKIRKDIEEESRELGGLPNRYPIENSFKAKLK